MRPHFRNVLRIPFECVASQGKGCAGHVAVFAFETDDRTVGASRQLADAIDRRHDARAIAASHVGRALSVPAYGVFGLPEETGQDRQKIIAIVEITTAEGAAEELQWLQGTLAQNLPVARVLRAETSTLIYKVHHEEVVAQWRRPSAMAVSRERT